MAKSGIYFKGQELLEDELTALSFADQKKAHAETLRRELMDKLKEISSHRVKAERAERMKLVEFSTLASLLAKDGTKLDAFSSAATRDVACRRPAQTYQICRYTNRNSPCNELKRR